MSAVSIFKLAVSKDTKDLLKMILHVDPDSARHESSCYRKVRARLYAIGWSQQRFDAAVRELKAEGRLFLSKSRKTLSFSPIKKTKKQRCVYCGKSSKKLTKDHVIPKSKGGAKDARNIVMACRACNFAKGDRTPAEWARDILMYRTRV